MCEVMRASSRYVYHLCHAAVGSEEEGGCVTSIRKNINISASLQKRLKNKNKNGFTQLMI